MSALTVAGCGGDDAGGGGGDGGDEELEAAYKDQIEQNYLAFWMSFHAEGETALMADADLWLDAEPTVIISQMAGLISSGGPKSEATFYKHTLTIDLDLDGDQAVVHDCFVDDVVVLNPVNLMPGDNINQTELLDVTVTNTGRAAVPWRIKKIELLKTWDGVAHDDCQD
jgi:hypothetical protein